MQEVTHEGSKNVKKTTPGMRKMLLIASLLVFSIGISLFLLTHQTEIYFAWTIKSPITAAFLGACYWASGILELSASRENFWSNARSTVPAVWVFTAITLVITFIHLDRFHFDAPDFITILGTWVWLGVYFFVPIILGFLWIQQWRKPGESTAKSAILPHRMRQALYGIGFLMLPIGILFLFFPATGSPLWAWDLTPLTARATGAWLVGWSTLFLCSAWENDVRRCRAAFFTLLGLGLFQGITLLRFPEQVKWWHPCSWIWTLLLPSFIALGTWGLILQKKERA